MFRFSGRRRLLIVSVLVAGLAVGVAVQAAASGGSAPKLPAVPKPGDLKAQAAQAQAQLAAHPQAAATNLTCGQTITATTTLNGDLDCTGKNGLIIGANGITLNLGGHNIIGSINVADGTKAVIVNSNSDTVENGYIRGFQYGVFAQGTSDVVTTLQVNYTASSGVVLAGPSEKATSNTAAENFAAGLDLAGSDDTAQSNHVLNNGGGFGFLVSGGADKVLGNTIDGNGGDGIFLEGMLDTITGNTANFNGGYGIDAVSPQIDGGTNKASGNTNSQQCKGVVCAVE
jgi:DNA/RNA endonuclease YhcR with UshA esterase domain